MIGDSFNFGKYNSRTDWGIKAIAIDVLLPAKKVNKINIPGKHGMFESGKTVFQERIIQMRCVLEQQISKAALREIAYHLSSKKRLVLWNEPDKFYVAEIYDTVDVSDFPKEIMREFNLTFICEPFAYKDISVSTLATGRNKISYEGTFDSDSMIRLTNTGLTNISNIQITATKRR